MILKKKAQDHIFGDLLKRQIAGGLKAALLKAFAAHELHGPKEAAGSLFFCANPGKMRRKLAGFEHSLTYSSEFAPFHLVCVLQIAGAPGADAVRRALASLQRRHPLLRARIESENGAYFFDFDHAAPVPLVLAERKSPDDWIAAAEDELNLPLDFAAGPLLRCRFLRTAREGEAEVLLTFHHSIVDARSVLPLLQEFLTNCTEEVNGRGGELGEEGAASCTAMFPGRFTGLGYARTLAFFMFRQMGEEGLYRWRSRKSRKPSVQMDAHNRILPVRFPSGLTETLIRATRKERVTVNSILTAALMLAVKRHLYPSQDTPLRNITFADLRPHLRRTIPDSVLGCYMGMCRFTIQMEDRQDFWSLAREVNKTITQSNRRGERFLGNKLSPGMMRLIFRLKSIRMGTTALSYAGPITVEESTGAIRVLGVHAFISNMGVGPEYSALVRLFRGELWWDMLFLDSDMSREKARVIAEEIRAILETAVGA